MIDWVREENDAMIAAVLTVPARNDADDETKKVSKDVCVQHYAPHMVDLRVLEEIRPTSAGNTD